MNTASLDLGRFTPRTRRQRESALAGIAQCNADWACGELTTSDDMIRQGRDPYWRAGYRVRWHEHVATLRAGDDPPEYEPDDSIGDEDPGDGESLPSHIDKVARKE